MTKARVTRDPLMAGTRRQPNPDTDGARQSTSVQTGSGDGDIANVVPALSPNVNIPTA